MTDSALKYAYRDGGPWQRVLPGIYATFSGSLSDLHRLRAAVLCAGPGSLITGAWACKMSGLSYGPDTSDVVDVLVPPEVRRKGGEFVRLIRSKRPADATNWYATDDVYKGTYEATDPLAPDARRAVIPMVQASRAVVDAVTSPGRLPSGWQEHCLSADGWCRQCRDHEPHNVVAMRNVRAVMCEVVQRRKASVKKLSDEVASAPRRGSALARRALDDIVAGCRSAPECELRDLVRTSRVLTTPHWNKRLPETPQRIYPDACWPDAKLVVEVDSRSFHGFGDAPEKTEQRRALYAELGWRVFPISPKRLRSEPKQVLRELEAAFRAGIQSP